MNKKKQISYFNFVFANQQNSQGGFLYSCMISKALADFK